MNMKRYINIILCVFLFTGTGCADWINVDPENSVTFENYFKSEKDAQSLLFTVQIKLRDLHTPFKFAELHDYKWWTKDHLPDVIASFEGYYQTIAAADMIIDNAFRFPLGEEVIRPYLLQAYFAKAYTYFLLAKDFGEAPIVKDGQSFQKYAKSSVSEVLDEAEKWALMAQELPAYENLKLGDLTLCKQYASKGAATALLAKLYAWRAGVEGKTEYWAKAEEMCSQIIENKVGIYDLERDPEAVCKNVLHRDNKESIWELYQDSKEQSVFYHNELRGLLGFPIVLTVNPTDDPSYYTQKETVREMYDDADLRKHTYFWATDADSIFVKVVDGVTMASTERGTAGKVTGAWDNTSIKKAFITKFLYPSYVFYDNNPEPQWNGMDQNVVKCRLADIYLLRAECRVRQNKPNAVEDLNRIRRRAYGSDDYAWPNADDVAKGLDQDLQLAIFREREKELFEEGHRYYDARRNGVEYVQTYIPHYKFVTEQDIKDGALYAAIGSTAFMNNDLLRQNVYWNRRNQ